MFFSAAYAMQTGYEGFLVPVANPQSSLFSAVKSLVPSMKTILFAIGKIASVLVGATGMHTRSIYTSNLVLIIHTFLQRPFVFWIHILCIGEF